MIHYRKDYKETYAMLQNWAVVCGAIRSVVEFKITINAVLRLRQQGLIHGIVVSTWNDMFTDKPELKKELLSHAIIVVEVPGLKDGGNGQTYRQHRLFETGLNACPEQCAVLKLRSDKVVHRLSYYTCVLQSGPVALLPHQSSFQVMKAKVSIQAASLTMPFNHADLVFYGLKEDVASLVHMDLFYDAVFFPGSINAEVRWFLRPFLNKLKIFRQFFEFFNCRAVSDFFIESALSNDPDLVPDILYDVIAANMLVIHHNFDIASPDVASTFPSASELFSGTGARPVTKIIPMTMTKHAACYSNSVIKHFVRGDFNDDTPNEKLKAAFLRLKDPQYLQRNIVPAELKAIHAKYFPDTILGNEAQSIVRFASNVSESEGVSKAGYLDIHFSGALEADNSDQQDVINKYIMDNSVDTNLAELYYKVAQKYLSGELSDPHNKAAHYWLKMAAENRFRPAEKAWADVLKDSGDTEKAAQWYKKAAERNDKDAQRELAILLRDNSLTSIDDDWHKWMDMADDKKVTQELPL